MDLSEDWYVEHDGQRLVLDTDKVAAEIERLRAALDFIQNDPRIPIWILEEVEKILNQQSTKPEQDTR